MFVIGTIACDSSVSNEEGTEIQNEFTLNVSPADTSSGRATTKLSPDTTIEGYTFFYVGQNSNDQDVFSLYLSGNNSFKNVREGFFGGFERNSGLPATNSYDLVEPDRGFESDNFIGVLYEDDPYYPVYIPQTGTITINKRDTDKLTGSVNFTAYRVTFETSTGITRSTRVTVSGNFTAKKVDDFVSINYPPISL